MRTLVFHSRRRASNLATGVCLIVLSAACASRPEQPDRSSVPQTVAVNYVRALFSGDINKAASFVEPSNRGAFLAVTNGIQGASIRGEGIAAGSSSVQGSSATVVMIGTICTSGSMAPLPSGEPTASHCVTNKDPHTRNPVFMVSLAMQPDGNWSVIFGSTKPT